MYTYFYILFVSYTVRIFCFFCAPSWYRDPLFCVSYTVFFFWKGAGISAQGSILSLYPILYPFKAGPIYCPRDWNSFLISLYTYSFTYCVSYTVCSRYYGRAFPPFCPYPVPAFYYFLFSFVSNTVSLFVPVFCGRKINKCRFSLYFPCRG